MRTWLALGCSFVALASATRLAHPQPTPRTLTLQEAVAVALKQTPEIRASNYAVDGARSRLDATRADRLPTLTADANLLMWDRAIVSEVMQNDGTTTSFTIRDRVTSTAQLTLRMPLTGQLMQDDRVDQHRAGLSATEADRETARLEAAYRAALAYLELLHAEAAARVANDEVEQIETQLDVARALEKAGVLERVDGMRIESALAGARSREVRAHANVTVGRSQLLLSLGMQPPSSISARDTFPSSFRAPAFDVDDLMARAARARPELLAARHRVDAARGAARVERSRFVPDIAAIATYQHTEGAGTLTPKNAWAVGLTMHWDIWTWGGDRQRHREAVALAHRDAVTAERLVEIAGLDVRIAHVEAQTTYDQLGVASKGLAAAEESFRIQNERFSKGVVTTTDLLEVRTELTRARLEHARARFAYLRALVGIARVVGELPDRYLSHL